MSEGKSIVAGQLPDGSIALLPLATVDNKTLLPVSINYSEFPVGVYLPAQQYVAHSLGGVNTVAPALSANAIEVGFAETTLAPGASAVFDGATNWDFNSAEFITFISAIDPLSVLTMNLYASDGDTYSLVASWLPTAAIGTTLFFVSPFAVTAANLEKRACFPALYRLEAVVSGAGAGVTFKCVIVERNI